LDNLGINTDEVRTIPGEYTASYFCNTDLENNQIASFYPGAMSFACQQSLHHLQGLRPDLVVISPNDPEAMKCYVHECKELGLPYLYDPSQQLVRLSEGEVLFGLDGAFAVFINEYEFALIQKKTGFSAEDILRRVGFMVVTRGKEGASIYTRSEIVQVPVIPPVKIEDPTGVGDAFRGGFLAAFHYGLDWQICGLVGSLAATYCLERPGPQGHFFTPEEFVRRLREHIDDQGVLDKLLPETNAESRD
jgi:adenosine kinase